MQTKTGFSTGFLLHQVSSLSPDRTYSIKLGLSLTKQLMSLQKMFVISKVHYFDFLISLLYNFDPLSLSLKWVMILVATTYRSMASEQTCITTYMMRLNGSERRPFIFIFRWNIACTIRIRQMKLSWKLRNGNKNF